MITPDKAIKLCEEVIRRMGEDAVVVIERKPRRRRADIMFDLRGETVLKLDDGTVYVAFPAALLMEAAQEHIHNFLEV